AFVEASPHGNVFCSTKFLNALPVKYELATMLHNEEIVLGAIILISSSDLMKAPFPMTTYQGVLCCRDYQEMPYHRRSKWLVTNLTNLLVELEQRFPNFSFCLSPSFDDVRAFQWLNYHEPHKGICTVTVRYTGILDLQKTPDFERYLSEIRSVRRQEYQKSLADGYHVRSVQDIELLNYLHRLTFERQGLVRTDDEERLLLSISRAALEKGYGEMLVCCDKHGNPASATLFLYDQRFGYYLVGANSPDHRKSGSGTLLLLENIKRCFERKLIGVDFVGINSPDRGDFKTSFNAQPSPYFVVSFEKSVSML